MRRATRSRGFSLLELMIVIAIIGLLAGLVSLRLWHTVDDGRRAAAQVEIRTLSDAIGIYRLKTGTFPASLAALAQPGVPGFPRGIVEQVKPDPWGRPYHYAVQPDGDFLLCSWGADGSPGGEGEAADVPEERRGA